MRCRLLYGLRIYLPISIVGFSLGIAAVNESIHLRTIRDSSRCPKLAD